MLAYLWVSTSTGRVCLALAVRVFMITGFATLAVNISLCVMLMSTADGHSTVGYTGQTRGSRLAGRGAKTMAAGLEREEIRVCSMAASCRLMASVTLRFARFIHCLWLLSVVSRVSSSVIR
jgi:hypothetical protein